MAASIYITQAGTSLAASEVELIGSMARTHGRVTLLVPTYAEGEVARKNLADAGLGVSVDVLTPAAWLEGLWRLLGDGTQLVSRAERLLVASRALAQCAGEDGVGIAPLKDNPGSVQMIAEMAERGLPFALSCSVAQRRALSRSEARSLEVLSAYADVLAEQGLAEPAQAALDLAEILAHNVPRIACAVVVRGATRLPEYLLQLFEALSQAGGLVAFVFNGRYRAVAAQLAERFGCAEQELVGAAPASPQPSFAEVCGPTARAASYAELAARLLDARYAQASAEHRAGATVALAAPDSLGLFDALAPRLAARGVSVQAEAFVPFTQTRAGQMFFQLIDFIDRLNNAEASAWWPAPDVVDWLRSPFSGVGPAASYVATSLDTLLRKTRTMDKERLFAELESRQSREQNRERARAEEQNRAPRPVVFKAVLDALDGARYARALRLMHDAGAATSPSAFGAQGLAAQQAELAALERVLEVLDRARELGVSGARALVALQALNVRQRLSAAPASAASGSAADTEPSIPCVKMMNLSALAAYEPGSYDAVLLADMSAEAYPLAERDTAATVLAQKLGCSDVCASPASVQRDRVARALQATSSGAALTYVARDNAADECFPALAYAELRAEAETAGACTAVGGLPGEGALFANLDPAGGRGVRLDAEPRQGEHVLVPELAPYVLLPYRCLSGRPVTRTLSASQVEAYLACPYRWLVSNRVSTRRLDVEFGPIERGNFSHDVMQRFYERMAEAGLARVTPENIERAHKEMDAAFDDMRADHLRGRYTHGKYAEDPRPRAIRSGLVSLDELERMRVGAMRAQFHEVVRHDAEMLSIFAPVRLEYSFDRQGVTYAGRPLGGRIDRIDLAPDAGHGKRFVVIDYKTGANVDAMACPDPTMQLEEGEELPEDWLPGRDRDRAPKVQTLMYATALERMTGGIAEGAVYYGLRGPSVAGAVSSALVESEPPAFPDDKVSAFPGIKGRTRAKHDGSLGFSELLAQTERAIAAELDRMQAGEVAPRPASDSCAFCPLTMCEKRR